MPKSFPKIDLSKVQTYPISNRLSKVSLAEFATPASGGASFGSFLTSLPDILIGADFRHLIRTLSETIRNDKTIAIGIGLSVIRIIGIKSVFNFKQIVDAIIIGVVLS